MTLLYFAGPLFSDAERTFNATVTQRIEGLGFRVFLPQREGAEKDKETYASMSVGDRRKAVFEIDRDQVLACDIFLFVLDGRVPDEGAAVELGIAYADKYLRRPRKFLIGLHTDSRSAFIGAKLNPMLAIPLDTVATSVDDLLERLRQRV